MKRPLRLALAAILALFPAATPARACCENFWSCVGAVATLGVSCKVEQIAQAIDGIKKLLAAVSQTRAAFAKSSDDAVEQGKEDVRQAGDEMKDDARKGLEDIKQAMSDTELATRKQTMKLASRGPGAGEGPGRWPSRPAARRQPLGLAPPPGRPRRRAAPRRSRPRATRTRSRPPGAPAPCPSPPADPARVAADLKRALERVQSTHTAADKKQAPSVGTEAQKAQAEVLNKEADARKVVKVDLFDPLDAIQGQLEHILAQIANPFDFSSVGAYVDQQVKLIQSRAPGTMSSMSKELVSKAGDRLKDGQRTLDDLKKGAEDSQKVAELSKKVGESGKQSDLKKLEAYIGAPPNSASFAQGAVAGLGGAGGATGLSSRSIAAGAFQKSTGMAGAAGAQGKTLSTSLASKWNATKPLLQLAPVAVTPAMKQRVSGDLAKMFSGKSPADAKATQADLLAQAKVHFANDPKTLAAVETYPEQKTASLVSAAAPASSAPLRR